MSQIVERLGPVPPVDEVTRLRLERAVLAEMERTPATHVVPPRRSRWRVATIGAAVAATAAAAVVLWTTRGDEAERPPAAARFAAEDSAVVFEWGDAAITLEPGTAVVAAGDAATGVVVVIERGAARFEVEARADRPRFAVIAGEVEVEVVGTVFRVERRGDAAAVAVDEGVVRVKLGGPDVLVEAGEQWPDPVPVPLPLPLPDPTPVPEIEMDPESAPAKKPKPKPSAPVPDPAPTAAPDPAADYARAARLEATDVPAARAIYRQLAKRTDSWGATALYALAILESAHGKAAAATRWLREYLERFPQGENAADARAMLDRL